MGPPAWLASVESSYCCPGNQLISGSNRVILRATGRESLCCLSSESQSSGVPVTIRVMVHRTLLHTIKFIDF